MSVEEAMAPVTHNSHDCPICIDLDLTDYYFRATKDWQVRLAFVKLKALLGAWHP